MGRAHWAAAAIVAGFAGLATSYAAAMVLTIRDAPVVAVAEVIIDFTPGAVVERAIKVLGHADKPALMFALFLIHLAVFAVIGLRARQSWWQPIVSWVLLAMIWLGAVLGQAGAGPVDVLPVVVGLITWITVHAALNDPINLSAQHPDRVSHERRGFLMVAGTVGLAAAGLAVAGRVVGSARQHVEVSRQLLRIDGVTRRPVPKRAALDVAGIEPWRTSNEDFYLIHTAISVPAIEPAQWSLRIHGMVRKEMTYSFEDLTSRQLTESWITLSCVSNPVGGDLVGNARWSGVRIADLLAEAGVLNGADCVRQTSWDGWDCATPLAALTDGRDALLAVAMNGKPLPIEHGFPVRSIVPGLYGFVSATKWVVDFEVTRFADVETFWTTKGWSEQGPVKLASRIDVPRSGSQVPAGQVRFAGSAWHQHTGIAGVEVQVDGRAWEPAQLGAEISSDTWVHWMVDLDVPPGEHSVRVRAISRDGQSQTGVVRDVVPDGATGWHTVDFTAVESEASGR